MLLPKSLDNDYRGQKLALWIFGLVVALRLMQGTLVTFDSRHVAITADAIPVDSYPAAAAQTIVALFALNGFRRTVVSLLCVLALIRYRAAVPLMFLVLLFDYLGGRAVLAAYALPTAGTPVGQQVNLVAFVVTLVGFALSLWPRRRP